MRRISRLFIGLLLCAVLVTALASIAAWQFARQPVSLAASPLSFDITPGASLRVASQQMVTAGVEMPAWKFHWLARLLGKAAQIQAGSYEVETGVTPLQLLQKLTRGDTTQTELVLVEGKTFADFRRVVDAHPEVRHDSAGMTDAELLAALGIEAAHPEGLFFPDTYVFSRNAPDLDIYRRAHQSLARSLENEWNNRAENLPYRSPYEALIMASIIEKETGSPADRARIAAVFVNRLRIGMRLQTDPTVIYGLREFDGNLRKNHLGADTPYNTYTRAGLPPTPISLPGLASLHAALNPAQTRDFYFVARGDGSSEFSRTLDDHNRAVARYQLRRK